MNNFAICLLFVGVSLHSSSAVYPATGNSVSSGASSSTYGGGGTYTQTSNPSGTFTTTTGDGAPFAPFLGQPAAGLPGPFIPIPAFEPTPLISPNEFSSALNQYLNSIQKHYATLYKQQQKFIEQWRDAQVSYYNNGQYGGSNPSGGGAHSGAGSGAYSGAGAGTYSGGHTGQYVGGGVGASATGTYGPSGVHQTASLYPANPAQPNLDTRFGGDDSPSAGGSGYYGVGTASFSSSSDINGQKHNKHGAITTVNDNGKVTTYRLGD